MSTTTDGEYWADEIGLTEDLDPHEVEAEKFCDVYEHGETGAVFDEGWDEAFIQSDTVVEVRR